MKKDINIIEIIKLMLKKWWVIAVSMVVIGSLVYAYTIYFIQPIYVSTGMLYVKNEDTANIIASAKTGDNVVNLSDIVASQALATTYIEILKSETFMNIVIEKAGLNYSTGKLRSMISINAKNETEILNISVRNTDPKIAAKIGQIILSSSKDEILRVIKGGSVEIIDDASLPIIPSEPNVMKNTILGIFVGIIVGFIIIFILDLLDNRIKNQDDLIEKYEFPVIGLIPSFRKSKDAGYYGNPMDISSEETININ